MYDKFEFEEITYREQAPGWVDGVYYPRAEQDRPAEKPPQENGAWKLHSRVWQEIEETGFGIYYYEETTRLVTELSGADYRVTVTLTNPEERPYSCHIRVNGILKEGGVEILPGEEKTVSFTACMTDGKLGLTLSVGVLADIHGEVIEGDVYVKDIAVSLLPAKEKRDKPCVFLVSDSTVQSYEPYYYPQTGWGQMLSRFFQGTEECRISCAEHCDYSLAKTYELPGLVIENRSIGGRSARSFYDEGKLDQVLEVLCPGDFMFVQFAHNDATAIRPNRYIAPADFPFFLKRYADGCRRRGAQLVFVTPVTMRVLDENGKNIICFAEYREQMMRLAEQLDLPLLDLSARSTEYLNRIGSEESKRLYLWLEEGEYPDGAYAAGVSDKCHLQEYGAKIYADMVVRMIEEYDRDDRLDVLKRFAASVPVEEIGKPVTKRRTAAQGADDTKGKTAVTGFAVQEVSVENGRGSFLLTWDTAEEADCYHIYAKKEQEAVWQLVRTVTKEEKAASPVLPFTAEAGALWQYYVAAVFGGDKEGAASRLQQVDLRRH